MTLKVEAKHLSTDLVLFETPLKRQKHLDSCEPIKKILLCQWWSLEEKKAFSINEDNQTIP